MLKYILLAFVISLVLSVVLIKYKSFGGLFSDGCSGPQKFHKNPVPRAGGLSIFIGFVAASLLFVLFEGRHEFLSLFVLASLPVFLTGFMEDLFRKIRPAVRLAAAMISGLLGIVLYGALIIRLDIPFAGSILIPIVIAFLFTIIGVAGVANSINIIDGFNGLSSMIAVMIFIGLAYVSFKMNDHGLFFVCLVMIASLLGFLVFNYPFGFIFLGDGGAYFIGFVIAEVSVILTMRFEQVSVWFPMLLVVYPVFETLFSMYRRKVLKGISSLGADGMHFHTLIYKRIMKFLINKNVTNSYLLRNSGTSVFIWAMQGIIVLLGMIFWNNTDVLILLTVGFMVFYVYAYRRIVRFKIQVRRNNGKEAV